MVFFVLLIVLSWLVFRYKTTDLSRTGLLTGWFIKVIFGVAFMFIHTQIYGIGAITVDWEEYIHDSVVLNDVAYQSFGTYLKFLFGFNSDADTFHYLMNTNHWSVGDMSLINDSRNVLRINSVLVFFSGGQVYVHILFFAFFSFIGLVELFHAFKDKLIYSPTFFWFALILFPTLGFWTSSVLKEPMMITGLAFLLHALFGNLSVYSRVWRLVLGLTLMLLFKPYVLFCLLLCIPIFFLGKLLFKKRLFFAPILVFGSLLIFLVLNSTAKKELTHRLTRMQFDFMNVGRGGMHVVADSVFYYFQTDQLANLTFSEQDSVRVKKELVAKKVTPGMKYPFDDVVLRPADGPWKVIFIGEQCGSYIELTPINNSFSQLIRNIPEAFVNAAFRPTFWDPGGQLKILNCIETICLFSFLIFTCVKYRKYTSTEIKNIRLFLACFALVLFVLIGLTTPVLGALVRYRLPAYLAIFLISMLGTKPILQKHE